MVPGTEETEMSGLWKLELRRNKVAMGGRNRILWGFPLKQALPEDKIIGQSASCVTGALGGSCPERCYRPKSVLF